MYVPAVGLDKEKRALGVPSYTASLTEFTPAFLVPREEGLVTPLDLLELRSTGNMLQPKHTSLTASSMPTSTGAMYRYIHSVPVEPH